MAEPISIKERITQAVADRLAGLLTTNAPRPGQPNYLFDLAEVVRPRRTGERLAPQSYGCMVSQQDEQEETDEDCFGDTVSFVGRRLPISLDFVVNLPEIAAEPMDAVLNRVEAEARRCLMADPTFGGLAINARIQNVEYPADVCGLTLWLDVVYVIAENDPYRGQTNPTGE